MHKIEIWNVGIIKKDIYELIDNAITYNDVIWIENKDKYSFLADPFAIKIKNDYFLFVEEMDYKTKNGVIRCITLDNNLSIKHTNVVLEEKYHLSYPFIVKEKGKIFMIPEAASSNSSFVYAATDFPNKWCKSFEIFPGEPLTDPSFIYYNNMWWLFYCKPGDWSNLCVAYSKDFYGPWKKHTLNPVMHSYKACRPGGTPFILGTDLVLPLQNCAGTYGKEVQLFKIKSLSEDHFSADLIKTISPSFHKKFKDGLHTFSNSEDLTFLDCKYFKYISSKEYYFLKIKRLQNRICKLFNRCKNFF